MKKFGKSRAPTRERLEVRNPYLERAPELPLNAGRYRISDAPGTR